VKIRGANDADIPVLETIVEDAYGGYVHRIGIRPAPMDANYEERVRHSHVFVADDGEVLGLIVLIPADDHLLVENVAVAPVHQGAGVGRRLLRYAEEHARDRGLDRLCLYTNAAMAKNIELYRRLGYREDERRGEGGFERVFFSKRLPSRGTPDR
jgi:ribosomal protein S18 acetylase RimI-like enzyme